LLQFLVLNFLFATFLFAFMLALIMAVSFGQRARRMGWFWAVCLASVCAGAAQFQQTGSLLVMSHGNVSLQYDLSGGQAAFYWQIAKGASRWRATPEPPTPFNARRTWSTGLPSKP
jgi:hypothetical protein